MEYEFMGLILAIMLWVAWAMVTERGYRRLEEQGQLPPGPRWWPVVGNIFQLGWAPHESFAKLARKHGPIMTLWLGSMSTVVISSSEEAREMFKNHDVVLAGRKIYEAMKGDYGSEGSLITSQYGPHWRMLRRLSTTQFFVTSRLDSMQTVRSGCIDRMVQFIQDAGESGTKAVDVGRFFFVMSFNLIGNLMFSKDLLDPKSERGMQFFHHAGKVMELAGKPNVADFLPLLRCLDPQGIRRKTQFHVERAFEIAGGFIKERIGISMENGYTEEKRKDFLDVLLEFRGDGVEEPSKFSSRTINVIVFEMFTAGTDTTTSTLEWAMAELLHNPKTLNKVQAELRSIVTPDKKMEERDIENLPYLKAVIKETLRLHPPLPFLVPHMAMDSCKMLGYYIPKETQILVNVWAIGRDPKTWKDPLVFKPERFLEPNMVDYKGHHFEFIPFGSGRRMCPAVPLASRVLPLALGSLLHSFDWVLADGLKPEDMDMTERMGITLRKAVPLKVIPVPYKGWPVFGNMTFDLGTMPHRTLAGLRPKYGHIVWLNLGAIKTMYGPYWRILRRISSMELLVNKRINDTAPLRRKCVDDMVRWIEEDAAAALARGESGEVNMPHFLFCMAFNLVGNLMLSRDLLDSQSKEGHEFFDAMGKIMEWSGKPNVADFFPFLKWLDPQGYKRNMVRDMGRAMNLVSSFVEKRAQEGQIGKEKEMFLAGSETTSSSIEWGMAELLRNPELMRKAREELDRVVGPNRKVEERDMDELPYLQAVMKETLRLHPALPLLVPRNALQDTNFMGYLIPKSTQVLVNAWAIGRDPDAWEDPLSFKPERFLGSNIDYKGQNFELIPFGSGRRICVGVSLAHRVVHLGLASLLHSFDWELDSNIAPETIDMNERMGITLRKLVPLKIIPRKRIACE
ncbi:hypothetical protein L1049_009341 [Liquidambar formosana]|uniref:Cytochrome P450 n=1 Tax=Liquidambar formosana TaxID=63359 RepID=A0AAP0S582_LIQFO